MNIRHLTERFAVADGAPNADQINDIKAQGFSAVVSLRNAGEQGEVIPPDAEGQAVEAAGMTWLHFPMEPGKVGDGDTTDDLSRKLQDLPAPVLIHCASGARAAGMAVAICAVGENWDLQTAARKADEAGIALPPALAPKVAAYIDARRGR